MRSGSFRSALLLVVLLCASCARAPVTSRVPEDPEVGERLWKRFTTIAARAENASSPFRLNATLYYSGKDESQRVSLYFWGNGAKTAPYPLRLDVLMGPGSVIASMREETRGLFIYAPRDATVYHAYDDGLRAFGMPLPFTLETLAALVTGTFARAFSPDSPDTPPAFKAEGGAVVYMIDNAPLAGFLTLSDMGLPVAWEDGTENGWRLAVEYWPESTRATPRKLHVEQAGEKREATLLVRELTLLRTPFTEKQLELAVPPNTPLAPLNGAR